MNSAGAGILLVPNSFKTTPQFHKIQNRPVLKDGFFTPNFSGIKITQMGN